MRYIDIGGTWQARLTGETDPESPREAVLPGTLDENCIGHKDENREQWHPEVELNPADDNDGKILTRLTRNYSYEGEAWFTRTYNYKPENSERVFLEVERSRKLSCSINGCDVDAHIQGTVSTQYIFEIGDKLKPGENEISLCCDNSYKGWPRKAIVYSSAATDETQTNWNGILGNLRLRFEKENFISAIRVYPFEKTVTAEVDFDLNTDYSGVVTISSKALKSPAEKEVSLKAGRHTVEFRDLDLDERAEKWDEGRGILYNLTAAGDKLEEKQVRFGIRTFGDVGGRLALNGRHIFLRSEANCCVFPENGHMPLTVEKWREVLGVYSSYGVNCMRFHSHCPPDAAFTAADEMGMLMQPELSHWNAKNAFEEADSWDYYPLELKQILLSYANHPSFVMLTFGNELWAEALGYSRMNRMVHLAKKLDKTRMYANSSNGQYGRMGPDLYSDFYTSSNYENSMIRGTSANMQGYINNSYPNSKTDFSKPMQRMREEFEKPVFSFEVGQYEVLPDFDEIEEYKGVTRPDNITAVREKAEKAGMIGDWKKLVEATGELSLLAYREEIEAVARTPELSGISLLGLQDFPGQGTALVGMINPHLQPKPFDFAKPERFKSFFDSVMALVLMDKYTYIIGEEVKAEIKISNFGKQDISGVCRVKIESCGKVYAERIIDVKNCPSGRLTSIGKVSLPTDSCTKAEKLSVTVEIQGYSRGYDIWVYPEIGDTEYPGIVMTQSVTEAKAALEAGGTVFLNPPADKEHFPASIKAQFTTDFWSVGTFPKQEGFMGCMMNPAHPVFEKFPTDFHTNWQWWPMCRGRSMILPENIQALVTGIDCYAFMRRMGLLIETKAGNGKLVLSSMGLMENKAYPEVRALIDSILSYMASEKFSPKQEMSLDTLSGMILE